MSDFTITIGKPSPLDREQRSARAHRAREVLDGAGWLFDEHMSARNRDLLATEPEDAAAREEIYRDIRCAAELKARLISIVETQQAEDRLHERRERTE